MAAPTPQHIVKDIKRVFEVIVMVVEARDIAVDFVDLSHWHRLTEHEHTARQLRRSQKISKKSKFGDVEGLHPISKRFIHVLVGTLSGTLFLKAFKTNNDLSDFYFKQWVL